jgi:hypothetical protein
MGWLRDRFLASRSLDADEGGLLVDGVNIELFVVGVTTKLDTYYMPHTEPTWMYTLSPVLTTCDLGTCTTV